VKQSKVVERSKDLFLCGPFLASYTNILLNTSSAIIYLTINDSFKIVFKKKSISSGCDNPEYLKIVSPKNNKHDKSSRSPGPSYKFWAKAKLNNIVYFVFPLYKPNHHESSSFFVVVFAVIMRVCSNIFILH
jgi:hypothetical protein